MGSSVIAALQFSAEIGRVTVLAFEKPGQRLTTARQLPARGVP
jgi:hypothetical protein